MTPQLPAPLRWAALRFRPEQREAYYDYLADVLEATQGRKTLKHILADDADRHGAQSARGRLSAHWAYQIEEHADVALAFSGTLPAKEAAFIGIMQGIGGGALAGGFRELAALLRLDLRLRGILSSTLTMSGFALCLSLATMFAIASFTVPALLTTFSQVDPLFHGPATRRLTAFAGWLQTWLWPLLLGLTAGASALSWALPRWHGRARAWCDRHLPGFDLYRDTQAIALLVSLAAILRPRAGLGYSLSEALNLLREHSRPWLSSHLARMSRRLSDAHAGAGILDTGLLNPPAYWYLDDLSQALGMDAALQKTRQRLEHATLDGVARRAQRMRWLLIAAALGFLLGVMLWHYAVIYEMRAALLLSQ